MGKEEDGREERHWTVVIRMPRTASSVGIMLEIKQIIVKGHDRSHRCHVFNSMLSYECSVLNLYKCNIVIFTSQAFCVTLGDPLLHFLVHSYEKSSPLLHVLSISVAE